MQILYKNDKPKPLKSVLVCSNEFIPEGIYMSYGKNVTKILKIGADLGNI